MKGGRLSKAKWTFRRPTVILQFPLFPSYYDLAIICLYFITKVSNELRNVLDEKNTWQWTFMCSLVSYFSQIISKNYILLTSQIIGKFSKKSVPTISLL